MKRKYHILTGLVVIGLSLGITMPILANPILIPTGLSAGDQYRLVFVTSATRTAMSTNINDYNVFVTSVAEGVPELLALQTTWKAIGSTAAVDARDNTDTLPLFAGGSEGVPIFLLNGTMFAANNDDLWNANVLADLIIDENGDSRGTALVFTGSDTDGTAFNRDSFFRPLGAEIGPGVGRTDAVNLPNDTDGWIHNGTANWDDKASLYGLSGVLTKPIPEPSTMLLLGSGLVGLIVYRWKKTA